MTNIEWDKEIIKIAQEISNLKADSESLAAIVLITNMHAQLKKINIVLWRMYYYSEDKDNPAGQASYNFYSIFNKTNDQLVTSLASEQLIINKRSSIASTAEGIFKTNKNYL